MHFQFNVKILIVILLLKENTCMENNDLQRVDKIRAAELASMVRNFILDQEETKMKIDLDRIRAFFIPQNSVKKTRENDRILGQSQLRDASQICDHPARGTNLPFCTILDGVNVTSADAAQTIDLSAQLSFKSMTLTGQLSSDSSCKSAYASFVCLQGISICKESAAVSLLPCLQRCLDYEISCNQLSSTAAAIACKSSSGISNTPHHEDCFCGSTNAQIMSPYDVCNGTCHPLSECPPDQVTLGSTCNPEFTNGARFCTVLNGTKVASSTAALAADAAAEANFASLTALAEINSGQQCRERYAWFMCVQGVTGCNNSVPVSLLPCIQRCTDYQVACRGLSNTAAASACQLTAGVTNTPANADCFCGRHPGSAASEVCVGTCDASSECGQSAGGLCTQVVAKGFHYCQVLEGRPISSQYANVAVIDYTVSEAFNNSVHAGTLANTPACRAAHAALECPLKTMGCSGGTQFALLPCLTRCLDYQEACLGASAAQAAAACAKTAGTSNAPTDADCFCGVDATVVGESGVCTGQCGPRSPCGQSIPCSGVAATGLTFCTILNGVTLRAGYSPVQIDAATRQLYDSLSSGGAVNVALTSQCQASFADYMCSQGIVGCSSAGMQALHPRASAAFLCATVPDWLGVIPSDCCPAVQHDNDRIPSESLRATLMLTSTLGSPLPLPLQAKSSAD